MVRQLLPREHGAYAELGFPLLSGLVLGSPGAAAWLFVIAAVLLFAANESLALLLGMRGQRARQELAAPASKFLALAGGLGLLAWLAALWLATAEARAMALVPAALAAAMAPVVMAKKLKSLPGEMLAGAAFSAMHLPVAAAGGADGAALWGPAVMWFVVTVAATFAVHAIKSRVTGAAPWVVPAAHWVARIALLAALGAWAWVPEVRFVALAACLPLAAVLAVNRLAISPKKLKQLGWTLVAANAVAVAVLVATSG